MMISSKEVMDGLDKLIPNPRCELDYTKDYELLIATVLSAQTTDKRVNMVTKVLFKYSLKDLSNLDLKTIENIIRPIGTYTRKAIYVKEIANRLLTEQKGIVPNNREYLETLPGVGRKVANVVLSNFFNEPCIAVDTHVNRVAKRLGFAIDSDDVLVVENKLMQSFPKDKWSRLHHQLVLFGRYTCKSKNPECNTCPFNTKCKYNNEKIL